MNSIKYKDLFPLIQENKIWLGATNFNTGMYFKVPNDFVYTDTYKFEKERNGEKVNRADVGWYQIRNALKKRNESGDFPPVSFNPFEEAYKVLSEKLQPQVYELGFLRI